MDTSILKDLAQHREAALVLASTIPFILAIILSFRYIVQPAVQLFKTAVIDYHVAYIEKINNMEKQLNSIEKKIDFLSSKIDQAKMHLECLQNIQSASRMKK